MARQLDVYLHDRLAGILEQEDSGQIRFRYAETWLAEPSLGPLSLSMPLQPTPIANRETRAFFAGLLPEADKRDLVARALGVSSRNDFALLDRIGGECAGAITFVRHGETLPTAMADADYRQLDDERLARILDALPDRPLLAGDEGVRLSLAGAQDKLPLLMTDGRFAVPLHGAPSSHILKPPIRRFEDTVHNEGFCLALAKELGLHVAGSEIRTVGAHVFLLVERYDRQRDSNGRIRRLHQEDLCQALAVPPEIKYQAEGGPSLKQCFEIVRRSTARPVVDLARLLDAVLFNLLVGNNDAHAKNFSLLFGPQGIELAPLYDISCTAVYPDLSPRFAMKIGDRHEIAELYPRHWERFARDVGLGVPQLRRRLLEIASSLPDAARALRGRFSANGHHRPIIDRILALIDLRADHIIKSFQQQPKPSQATRETGAESDDQNPS